MTQGVGFDDLNSVKTSYGKLFIVSTPIGNLSDITFRAVETLKNVDIIACEDTRNTKILCEKYDILTPLISYHKFSESQKTTVLMDRLKAGESAALVSDAGTPLISDPGVKLVEEARLAGIDVVPVVGASAILALLASIPRGDEGFKFIGFLPRIAKQIENLLKSNRMENLIFYESPNRLLETLSIISNMQNGRKMAIGRELTKKFEEIKVDTVENLLEYYKTNVLKGEIACMLYALEENNEDETFILEKIEILRGLKLSDKDIAGVINSLYGLHKNKIKEILLNKKVTS